MQENLRTFINIFEQEVLLKDGNKISPKKIIIPIIQRDYAQGREITEIRHVRQRFLDALYKAVTEKPVKLDFIYGDISEDGILTPLDGQQRLTTLFLLHWYAAKKENISSGETKFLKNFSYETRPDSTSFCKNLINFQPAFDDETLSAEIENQSWFPLGWKKDPTVNSMLNMLDAIDEKFCSVENLFEKLQGGAISFYFLAISDMGLTDELYITMNSRGKPLTDFEHFKAEFKRKLDELDRELADKIIFKIDTIWTDLLWNYRDEKNLIDGGFLRYFRFLCDILLYKRGGTPQGKNRTEFDLIDEIFKQGDVYKNIDFIEKSFDCWCKVEKAEKISNFFEEKISLGDRNKKEVNKHTIGKIICYFNNVNLFEECLKFYGTTKDGRIRKFSLAATVTLYAFLFYLLNREKIPAEKFQRRIRIINNLVNNSGSGELSDSESRNNGNRIPAMLRQIESILLEEKILTYDELREEILNYYNFNETQLKEERAKLSWTKENPDKAESLFELEDHYLLYGQIGIIGLEEPKYFERFISLFNCDYDKIDCALLACGDYLQKEGNSWRYQLGSAKNPKAWQNLFHQSLQVKGFDETQIALSILLDGTKNFSDAYLEKIIANHLADCESKNQFEWSYYYIKYKIFRPERYGKYLWQDFANKPYCLSVLWTEVNTSTNAYQPFLKAAEKNNNLSRDHYGMRLLYKNCYVECENNFYVVKENDTERFLTKLEINQKDGIDTEDRILKFKTWAEKNLQ